MPLCTCISTTLLFFLEFVSKVQLFTDISTTIFIVTIRSTTSNFLHLKTCISTTPLFYLELLPKVQLFTDISTTISMLAIRNTPSNFFKMLVHSYICNNSNGIFGHKQNLKLLILLLKYDQIEINYWPWIEQTLYLVFMKAEYGTFTNSTRNQCFYFITMQC